MSARECPACDSGVAWRRYGPPCPACKESPLVECACSICDGTGKVHPSVEGEIVVELHGRDILLPLGAGDGIEAESIYKVIVQKVGE